MCSASRQSLRLQKRLRNRELTIAVIGQFKRGKTTLINSILGADILPVGIVPITSAVTKIKYGLDQAAVSFQHGGTQQVPLTKLDQYISEQENPPIIKKRRILCYFVLSL